MNHPDPTRKKFAILEGLRRNQLHLRSVGVRNKQLAFELILITCCLSGVIPIRDDNIVDASPASYRTRSLGGHRRWVHQDAMLAHSEIQPIEVKLLFL